MTFRLEILGGQLRGPEGPVIGPAVQRHRMTLLATLALAGERGISREHLLGLLWPDVREPRTRRSLSKHFTKYVEYSGKLRS